MKKKACETDKKKTEQPLLSDEQLELLNSEIEKKDDRSQIEPFDTSVHAQAVRYAKKHKPSAIILIIAVISVVAVIVTLLIYAISTAFAMPNKDDFRVIIGENTFTADYDDIIIDDIAYIDMNKLSLLDNITISGDSISRKYTLPNLQYVRFNSDSDLAIIDGNYISMGSKAIFKNNMCLVPYEFVEKITKSGIDFVFDKENNKITITRIEIGKGDNDTPVYDPITFSIDNLNHTDVAYKEFNINFEEYSAFIDPKETTEYLILVNHENPLSSSYIPNDLVKLTCATNPVNSDPSYYKLRSIAEKALSAMMTAMKNSNIQGIQVSSSYRSYARQEYLLQNYIESKMNIDGLSYDQAKKDVLKTLAMPGHSEHQTGLAVDFVQGTTSLTTDFENTTAFAWLSQNAHKFGFILRYPSDKVTTTGYDYEPWHYRFVGRTVASRIYEANICYEEYVALTK